MKDELTPVLEKAMQADVLLLGSPVYMGNCTGMMQSFLERLLFPCVSYGTEGISQFDGKINSALFYTMNMTGKQVKASGFENLITLQQQGLSVLNGTTETFLCTDTYQFKEYAKYNAAGIDEPHKHEVKIHRFPEDCEKAYELGVKLATITPAP